MGIRLFRFRPFRQYATAEMGKFEQRSCAGWRNVSTPRVADDPVRTPAFRRLGDISRNLPFRSMESAKYHTHLRHVMSGRATNWAISITFLRTEGPRPKTPRRSHSQTAALTESDAPAPTPPGAQRYLAMRAPHPHARRPGRALRRSHRLASRAQQQPAFRA